jgi:hypothetical protein
MIRTFVTKFDQKSKQEEMKVREEVEDEINDDLLPVQTNVQKVEPPVHEDEVKTVPNKQATAAPQREGNPPAEDEESEESEWDSEVCTGIVGNQDLCVQEL